MAEIHNLQRVIEREFNAGDSVYKPNDGEMVCYFTHNGIYGPVPFNTSINYTTFSSQIPLQQNAEQICINSLRDQVRVASAQLAQHCNHDVNFVYLQYVRAQCRPVRKYILASIDIGIMCVYRGSSGLMDLLDF